MSLWTSKKLTVTPVGDKGISRPYAPEGPPVPGREHRLPGPVLPGRVQEPSPSDQGSSHTLPPKLLAEVKVRNVNFVILPDTTHPLAGRRRPTNNVDCFEREE